MIETYPLAIVDRHRGGFSREYTEESEQFLEFSDHSNSGLLKRQRN